MHICRTKDKEAAMDSFIAFAEVTGAILAALGLALVLEWYGLNGLMHLMPASRRHPPRDGR
jgi:hypothetical protein